MKNKTKFNNVKLILDHRT